MKKKTNIPFLISSIFFVLSIIALICYIFLINKDERDMKKLAESVSIDTKISPDSEPEDDEGELEGGKGLRYYLIDGVPVQEGFKDLYLKNKDVIGWIRISETPVNYPVMYTPEDVEYYIHRGFDKEYSLGGGIFAGEGTDIERPCDNIITYGHHMANSSMYHDIDRYEDEDYYKEHKYITFNTLRQTGKYEVIAAYRTEVHPDDYKGFCYWKFVNAYDEKDFNEYIDNCKRLTPYKISTSAEYGDQLITLSTCAYHTLNGRFVVVAKRVKGKEIDYDKDPIEVISSGN